MKKLFSLFKFPYLKTIDIKSVPDSTSIFLLFPQLETVKIQLFEDEAFTSFYKIHLEQTTSLTIKKLILFLTPKGSWDVPSLNFTPESFS